MTKKQIIITSIASVILISLAYFLSISISSQSSNPQTAPLIPSPSPARTSGAGLNTVVNLGSNIPETNLSLAEKGKLIKYLPHRVEDFKTSVNLDTVINISSLKYDPKSVIRIEIYNINYNIPNIDQVNAIAFKESFKYAVDWLSGIGIDAKNLQIIYGNRQYIQDTASYWVSAFRLLD